MAKKTTLTPQEALTKIQNILGSYTSKGGRTISDQDKKLLKNSVFKGGRTMSEQDVKLLKNTAKKRSNTTMSQPRARGGAVRKMAKGGTAKKKK